MDDKSEVYRIIGSAVVRVPVPADLSGSSSKLEYEDVMVVLRRRWVGHERVQVLVMITCEDDDSGTSSEFVGVERSVRAAVEGAVRFCESRGYPVDEACAALVRAEMETARPLPPTIGEAKRKRRFRDLMTHWRNPSC